MTGIKAHIAISVVGILILVAYTIVTKKDWKIPALEIVMRVFYGIALITGGVIMKVRNISAIGIIHKACAALFVVLLIALFVHKVVAKKK